MDSLCIKIDGNNVFILLERNEVIFYYVMFVYWYLLWIGFVICYVLCIENVINVL